MKKSLAIIALAGFATAATADLYTFDISGLGSELDYGSAFPTLTHDFGSAGTVVGVSWDVNYESFSPSWNNEAQIAIDTTDDNSLDGDIDPGLYGAGSNSGFFAYSGSIGANSVSSDGLVFLTLWESFLDGTPNPDALYGANSTVTVEFTRVPAPGALALLGLGGVGMIRRRR